MILFIMSNYTNILCIYVYVYPYYTAFLPYNLVLPASWITYLDIQAYCFCQNGGSIEGPLTPFDTIASWYTCVCLLARSLRLNKTEYDYIYKFTRFLETKLETNLVGIFLNTLQHLNAAKSWHFPTFRSAGQTSK